MMGVRKISADAYCVCLVMGTGVGFLVLLGGSVLYLSVCKSRLLPNGSFEHLYRQVRKALMLSEMWL